MPGPEERIVQKIEMLIDRSEFIEQHISDEMLHDRILRKALYKELQEAVEIMMDIGALVRRSMHASAQDDYSTIDELVRLGILTQETGRDAKTANGLRNRLVHEYDGVDDQIAYTAMHRLLPVLRTFAQEITTWVKEQKMQS